VCWGEQYLVSLRWLARALAMAASWGSSKAAVTPLRQSLCAQTSPACHSAALLTTTPV